jgi:hypothetical protein
VRCHTPRSELLLRQATHLLQLRFQRGTLVRWRVRQLRSKLLPLFLPVTPPVDCGWPETSTHGIPSHSNHDKAWPRGRTDPPEEEARTTLPVRHCQLLDVPFPKHRASRENARKSGISILLCSLFLVGFRSSLTMAPHPLRMGRHQANTSARSCSCRNPPRCTKTSGWGSRPSRTPARTLSPTQTLFPLASASSSPERPTQ